MHIDPGHNFFFQAPGPGQIHFLQRTEPGKGTSQGAQKVSLLGQSGGGAAGSGWRRGSRRRGGVLRTDLQRNLVDSSF